jgi:hypothetical protein
LIPIVVFLWKLYFWISEKFCSFGWLLTQIEGIVLPICTIVVQITPVIKAPEFKCCFYDFRLQQIYQHMNVDGSRFHVQINKSKHICMVIGGGFFLVVRMKPFAPFHLIEKS